MSHEPEPCATRTPLRKKGYAELLSDAFENARLRLSTCTDSFLVFEPIPDTDTGPDPIPISDDVLEPIPDTDTGPDPIPISDSLSCLSKPPVALRVCLLVFLRMLGVFL